MGEVEDPDTETNSLRNQSRATILITVFMRKYFEFKCPEAGEMWHDQVHLQMDSSAHGGDASSDPLYNDSPWKKALDVALPQKITEGGQK